MHHTRLWEGSSACSSTRSSTRTAIIDEEETTKSGVGSRLEEVGELPSTDAVVPHEGGRDLNGRRVQAQDVSIGVDVA